MGRDHKPLRWSPEEDAKLIRFIKEHEAGTWDWASLPEKAGLTRSAKSCNSRWNDYLRDDFKIGNFTKEEEETIVRLHQVLGNRSATIAKYLPGRSNLEIKNHWKNNLMKRVRWFSKSDGTSEAVILPDSDNDENKKKKKKKISWENESSTSISYSSVGEELVGSITRLKQPDLLEEVYMVNNSLAKNDKLTYAGNGSCTLGKEIAWTSPVDFELYCGATDISSKILAENSNINYGRDGGGSLECAYSWTAGPGEELEQPTDSIYAGHQERAMVNNILDENRNLTKEVHGKTSMEEAAREMEQNSEVVEVFPEPVTVSNDAPQGDQLIVNTTTGVSQGSDEEFDASLVVSTPGLLYGDLGWHDSYFLYRYCGNLDEEEYFRRSLEVAVEETVCPENVELYPDQVSSDMPQGDKIVKMPVETTKGSVEMTKNSMVDLHDDGVGGHGVQPSGGLDSM